MLYPIALPSNLRGLSLAWSVVPTFKSTQVQPVINALGSLELSEAGPLPYHRRSTLPFLISPLFYPINAREEAMCAL